MVFFQKSHMCIGEKGFAQPTMKWSFAFFYDYYFIFSPQNKEKSTIKYLWKGEQSNQIQFLSILQSLTLRMGTCGTDCESLRNFMDRT